jgi:quercetin 2,3-dioxygenase
MAIRVVAGEIDAKDATTRVVIPTASQPRWAPFERVAETIATPRRPFPPHRHAGVEVLTYLIEGSGSYEFGPEPPTPVTAGALRLLTAPTSVSHAINPAKGQTVRWFAVIATLPAGTPPAPRLQSATVELGGGEGDEALRRRLVGRGTGITSVAGLEGVSIEFPKAATTFQKVGHDRAAVCYALAGRGRIDTEVLEGGEAALVDEAAGVALHGKPGFHVVFVSAPRKIAMGPGPASGV